MPANSSASQAGPALATRWMVKQVPVAAGYIASAWLDINDAGDAVGSYLISVNSGARTSSGLGIAHADGHVDTLGILTGQTASGTSINNAGQVAGMVARNIYAVELNQRGRPRAFVYANGTTTEVPLPTVEGIDPSIITTYAAKLNNVGDLAGYTSYTDAAGAVQSRAFVFSNGVRTDLVQPAGVTGTRAYGINDARLVVGQADYANGTTRAFSYRDGGLTDLGTLPGFASSAAVAVNNNGAVTGTLFNTQGSTQVDKQPFLYAGGVMRAIPLPASAGWAAPTAINTAGQIVGTFYRQDDVFGSAPLGGFLYGGGSTIDLNSLQEVVASGIKVTQALAINASGQILVTAQTTSGNRSFVLSPVK